MKKAFLFVPALLALSISTNVNAFNAYSGKHLVIVAGGDSLSDTGNNGCFTTDCNGIYAKRFDEVFGHGNLKPSKEGGYNYAQGGAEATNTTGNPFNSAEQLKTYFKRTNGKADPNAIYIHWIGGNDLLAALMAGQDNPLKAYSIMQNSANAAAEQITQLVNAGAGLIIAPTVPDLGTTPKLLETVLTTGLEKYQIPKPLINTILQDIHKNINERVIPSGEGRDLALKTLFKTLSQKAGEFGLDPTIVYKALTEGYSEASTGASKLTDAYNSLSDNKISQSNGNILRADINGLLHEVIDNPLVYGVSNNLGYACAVGVTADKCQSDDPGFDASKQFIFSDNFHPSPLAHKILAQYIASIYIAPSQVMTLNHVNRTPVKGTRASLDGHLQQLRNGGNEAGKFGVFGGYTGNRNNSFSLGGDYQLADNFLLGLLYSNDIVERDPTSNFTYSGNAHVATGYALWNIVDNAWLNGDIHYAHMKYDSLTRSIELGGYTQRESGSTKGKQWGARLSAGWDIPVADVVTTSPVIQFAWDKGEVDGYRESGDNSTSMHFSKQDYTSKVGTLGWRVDSKLGRINPYASVQFNHEFGDSQYQLRSAINATQSSFRVDSRKQSKDWRQYTLGANANLFGNIRGFASVTRNDGNSQDPNYNFSLGVNASF
ncbi:MAG: autotransporter domain-containing protein [Enterobacteriaceae bacterium]|nr:autotransporter domain-containing protein [Enterobacteriaceae bacterium]